MTSRKIGISKFTDDLVSTINGETNKAKALRYTRKGKNGLPIIDLDNPIEFIVDLPQHGFRGTPEAKQIFSLAHDNTPKDLESLISGVRDTATEFSGEQDIVTKIREEVSEAWQEISPAFLYLSGTGNQGRGREVGSKDRLDVQHKDFLYNFALAYYYQKKEFPNSEELLQRLYYDSNWIVNIPSLPGAKRLIPKELPLPFASDLDNNDIEFFLEVWNDEAQNFKNYLLESPLYETIRKDKDSNVQVYVDVSEDGSGISFFYKLSDETVGREAKETYISMKEFGDFIANKYAFGFLIDVKDWFSKIKMLESDYPEGLGAVIGWFGLNKREKLIRAIYLFDEAFQSGNKDDIEMYMSARDNSFIDQGNFSSYYLNKLGGSKGQPNPFEDDYSMLLGFTVPFINLDIYGVTPAEWADEINFLKNMFGGPEIGYMERQAAIKFLKVFKEKYPDPKDYTAERFNEVLNEEAGKYVITRSDWFDMLADGTSNFSKWARETGVILKKHLKENPDVERTHLDKSTIPPKYRRRRSNY